MATYYTVWISPDADSPRLPLLRTQDRAAAIGLVTGLLMWSCGTDYLVAVDVASMPDDDSAAGNPPLPVDSLAKTDDVKPADTAVAAQGRPPHRTAAQKKGS